MWQPVNARDAGRDAGDGAHSARLPQAVAVESDQLLNTRECAGVNAAQWGAIGTVVVAGLAAVGDWSRVS
jgi:hypothetical protein